MTWARAGSAEELWDGELLGVSVGGTPVLLVALEGEVHAYLDRCAHKAVQMSKGRLEGRVLTCFAHGWSYDACSGRGLNPERAALVRLPVRVEAGEIWVELA